MLTKLKLAIIILLLGSVTAYAVPQGNDLLDLVGRSMNETKLLELMAYLNEGNLKESYQPSAQTYSFESFEKGIALDFNQNMVLKEIRFYDSGYLYKKCDLLLPLNLKIGIHFERFRANYANYYPDTTNQFLYHGNHANGNVKLYFKDEHCELIKISARSSFVAQNDRENIKKWGYRLIPDGQCMNRPCYQGENSMVWGDSVLIYNGEFNYGTPHGEGTFQDSIGTSYSGELKLGFIWGEGKLDIPAYMSYEGSFAMGKRNGYGVGIFPNGGRYEGNWLNDKMQGLGKYYYSDRFYYEGTFSNNEIFGEGKLTTPQGYYQGGFKAGKPHGRGEQYVNTSQTRMTGIWVEGKKYGKFELYSPLFGTRSMYFKDDVEVENQGDQ